MKQFLIIMVSCAISIHMQAQFQLQASNLGETTTTQQAISVGSVAANADIKARLHVNNFFCNTPASPTFNGLLFRTDGDQAVNNRWQMFTGASSTAQTERFRIRTLANGFDTYLERTQVGSEADM